MLREPDRFGASGAYFRGIRIVEKDSELFWDNHGQLTPLEPELHKVDVKLEAMDRMDIDVSAISVAPPTYFYWLNPEDGLEAARLQNDGIADMVAAAPDRLRGMATLPMQDPDAAVAELERVVAQHGFKAVELGASIEGEKLADPKFRKVLAKIEELGCFIFIHPYTCLAKGGMEGFQFFNTIGFPLDEVIMAAHMMHNGTLDALPDLKVLIAHGGGYLPYQLGRLEHAFKHRAAVRTQTGTSPRENIRRFYFDTLTHDPVTLRYLIDVVGSDRITIGTDNPFDMGYEDPLAELEKTPRLSDEERLDILCRTALGLLGENSHVVHGSCGCGAHPAKSP